MKDLVYTTVKKSKNDIPPKKKKIMCFLF